MRLMKKLALCFVAFVAWMLWMDLILSVVEKDEDVDSSAYSWVAGVTQDVPHDIELTRHE